MRLSRAGKFPKPVITGNRTVNFVEDEVSAWIEKHIAARDAGVTVPRNQNLRPNVAKQDIVHASDTFAGSAT